MDLRVSTSTVAGLTVLSIDGYADLATIAVLRDHLQRAVRGQPSATIVVDLDGADVFDDTALGVVLGAAAQARLAGGDLVLVCSPGPLRDRLGLSRLDRTIEVHPTIAAFAHG